jgi:hypothetical protein
MQEPSGDEALSGLMAPAAMSNDGTTVVFGLGEPAFATPCGSRRHPCAKR